MKTPVTPVLTVPIKIVQQIYANHVQKAVILVLQVYLVQLVRLIEIKRNILPETSNVSPIVPIKNIRMPQIYVKIVIHHVNLVPMELVAIHVLYRNIKMLVHNYVLKIVALIAMFVKIIPLVYNVLQAHILIKKPLIL